MKKNLVINTVLYFILYSISLSSAWFEFGLEYPTVDGIGFIWLFPAVYLILFLISLRLAFVRPDDALPYLIMGISTIGFISFLWGISALVRLGSSRLFFGVFLQSALARNGQQNTHLCQQHQQ